MPKIVSAKQYGFLAAVAHGRANKRTSLTPEEAEKGIHELSPDKRSAFARVLAQRRKRSK